MEARRAALEGEVAEFRRLAAADGDHLYPGLAIALADLSSVLRDLDRRDEALQAAHEASDLFRVLADHDHRFLRHHAMSLNNLSARLQDAGKTAQALEASRAAVDAAAGLPRDEDGTPFILAAARLNMAAQLFILGGVREGTAVLCEIGRTIRRMIEAGQRNPAGGQLDILRQLAEQALDRRDWPLHVGLRRALMLALPGEAAPGLARALDEAATAVADSDRECALAWAEDAATEFARLAGDEPARFSAAAAAAAERWLRLACGDPEVAERAARALASVAAPASEHRATALTVLAMAVEGQARLDEALATVDDAVAAWRSLPGEWRRLASCLNLRAGLLVRAGGRDDEALGAVDEAVVLWRAAEAIDAGTDATVFADTLRQQAALLIRCGRWEAAMAAAEEGTRLLLSAIIHAGVGSSTILDDFERLRRECQNALRPPQ